METIKLSKDQFIEGQVVEAGAQIRVIEKKDKKTLDKRKGKSLTEGKFKEKRNERRKKMEEGIMNETGEKTNILGSMVNAVKEYLEPYEADKVIDMITNEYDKYVDYVPTDPLIYISQILYEEFKLDIIELRNNEFAIEGIKPVKPRKPISEMNQSEMDNYDDLLDTGMNHKTYLEISNYFKDINDYYSDIYKEMDDRWWELES